jgi:methylated-DNA-[protein]-cysteine S-methyltransferase
VTHFTLFPTALGACGIAWRDALVIATRLPEAGTGSRFAARIGATRGEPPPAISRAIAAITALLEGEHTDLSFIACDFSGVDAFASRVYAATRAIAPGETRTYGAIALQLGGKQLAQDVGGALGRNPFPIIVPCHRVVGANDRLVGFSANGGIATKLKMLAIEAAPIGEAPALFGDLPLAVKPRA